MVHGMHRSGQVFSQYKVVVVRQTFLPSSPPAGHIDYLSLPQRHGCIVRRVHLPNSNQLLDRILKSWRRQGQHEQVVFKGIGCANKEGTKYSSEYTDNRVSTSFYSTSRVKQYHQQTCYCKYELTMYKNVQTSV